MSDRDSGEVILSFLLGGVIGAVIGMLYAPRSGKETRDKLKDLSDELTDRLEDIGDEVVDRTEHIVEDGRDRIQSQKDRLEAAINAGKKAFVKKQPEKKQ